jgi:hypothetical protein
MRGGNRESYRVDRDSKSVAHDTIALGGWPIDGPWPLLAAGSLLGDSARGWDQAAPATTASAACAFSRGSIVAVGIFMATAIATVFRVRHILLGDDA